MRDFLMGVFSTMCLATASLMFVATAVGEGSLAGMFCSRPAGGCSPSLGKGHCVGQCTDEDLGDGYSCNCTVTPGQVGECYCKAE